MADNIILNSEEMRLIMNRLAAQILENHANADNIMLVGIQRRGADIAWRLGEMLNWMGKPVLSGALDINFYRDDWTSRAGGLPRIGESSMPKSPDGQIVILVDDVLFSGRTIRAALEAILDYGRPDCVELLAFIDRGHRELPICATYVGKKVITEKEEQVDVLLDERDGRECVILKRPWPPACGQTGLWEKRR